MNLTAAARAHSVRNFITKEKERIINSFTENPNIEHRATIKVTKQILLNGPYLLRGRYWEVIAKSLGAGVYSLKLEQKENQERTK